MQLQLQIYNIYLDHIIMLLYQLQNLKPGPSLKDSLLLKICSLSYIKLVISIILSIFFGLNL